MNFTASHNPATRIHPVSAAKSVLALLIPSTILLDSITAILYLKETHTRQMALELKETDRLNTQEEVIESYIQAIATDVLILSKHHELQMMMDSNEPQYREALAKELLWFSRIKRIYDQVRFLNEQGMESLCVNFNNTSPIVVALRESQPKSERYHFTDTFRLAEGQIFVSPCDLNIEHGKIELPPKPTIRFGTPRFDSKGRKSGVVVLNSLGSNLL
jgi:hypothetical protein